MEHRFGEFVRQRLYRIALGYDDLNNEPSVASGPIAGVAGRLLVALYIQAKPPAGPIPPENAARCTCVTLASGRPTVADDVGEVMTNNNFLTFDIEEWYHANYEGFASARYAGAETNLPDLVERIADLCKRFRVRTTFFVLGSVARAKPQIVRQLHAAGHEIASHGYGHETVYRLGPDAFRSDLRLSCDVLEQITGEKVLGFRAPSFSVTLESLGWYYDVLEELGLVYSSSVFPGRTFLYGVPGFPAGIHRPIVNGRRRRIVEFPVPRIDFLFNQMSLYIRFFPAWAILRHIHAGNRAGRPTVIYVHPREIDPTQPRIDLPFWTSLIHYWGIKSCERKLETLMRKLPDSFRPMRDYVAALPFSAEPVDVCPPRCSKSER